MSLAFSRLAPILYPLLAVLVGCAERSGGSATTIRVEGSDTMINIAEAWAERYHAVVPSISVQVLGGGSGVGIASLTDGNCDMANSSRDISEKESALILSKRGHSPIEHIVGFDALAVFVHPDNPLESISIEELARIFGEERPADYWSQLGVDYRVRGRDDIVRVSRQNSSGTYVFFRETVLGKKKDFKLGSVDRSGSKDAVSLVGHTPLAIGYSGMGYMTSEVKVLKISKRPGDPVVAPTVENAINGTYPLTRELLVYSVGELSGAAKEYMDWILSPEGQAIVVELGYVPVVADSLAGSRR